MKNLEINSKPEVLYAQTSLVGDEHMQHFVVSPKGELVEVPADYVMPTDPKNSSPEPRFIDPLVIDIN